MEMKIYEQRAETDYELKFFTKDEQLFRKAKILLYELANEKPKNDYNKMNIMLDSTALVPKRGHATDAGLDLLSPLDTLVPAKGSTCIDTGVHIELPPNTAGFLKSKSRLNVLYGITSEGVIDVGYTGSVLCKLYNHSNIDYKIKRGDKITQLVVMKIDIPELNVVDEFKATERGNNGFGSTGR